MKDQVKVDAFDTVDDARQKLNRTFVLYNNSLCFVHDVLNDGSYKAFLVGMDKKEYTKVPIKDIDFQAPHLGMFYSPFYKKSVLAVRVSARQYRGGLPANTLQFFDCKTGDQLTDHGEHQRLIFTPEFEGMLFNKYPSVEEVVKLLKTTDVKSAPISKFHWIKKESCGTYMLLFRTHGILFLTKDGIEIDTFESSSVALNQRMLIGQKILEFKNAVKTL